MKRSIILIATALMCGISALAQDIENGTDLIFDKEGLYTEEQKAEIGKILDEYQKKWENREIVVVTTKDIAPFATFADYASDLCKNWVSVRPEDTNALLLIISKKMGKVRISTAEGTTSLIENQACQGIISYNMMPSLKKGQFFEATKTGVSVLSKAWK